MDPAADISDAEGFFNPISRALFSAGISMDARIAMIAITTRSSINVKRTSEDFTERIVRGNGTSSEAAVFPAKLKL